MGRTRKNRDIPHPKPVKKIQLSERHMKERLAVVVLLLAVGVAAFAYAAWSALSTESGWEEIAADSGAETNCSEEFVFLYCLGQGGISPTAEKKAIVTLYTDAVRKAYMLFSNDEEFEEISNIYYINRHPNEVVEVDAALYEAFSLLQEYGSRYPFLAPAYERYDNIFYCQDDSQLVDFAPDLNEERAAEFQEIAAFARDPESVDIQLLGEGKVCLRVSDAYLKYASENGIDSFIDFYWMKNAFIVDYLADIMISNQYTSGSISSYDGFCRNLDDSGTSYSFNLYDRIGSTVYPAAVMNYSGTKSIVCLRDFPVNGLDSRHYYVAADGSVRNPYLDVRDGASRNSVSSLVCYSQADGCAEILIQMIPVYIEDTFREGELGAWAERGVDSIFCRESVICHTDPDLVLTNIYVDGEISYTDRIL